MQKAKTLSKLLLVILSIVVGINLSYAESRSYLSPIEQRKKREARLLLEKQKQAAGVKEESLRLLLEAQSKRSLDLIEKQASVQKAIAQRNQKARSKQQPSMLVSPSQLVSVPPPSLGQIKIHSEAAESQSIAQPSVDSDFVTPPVSLAIKKAEFISRKEPIVIPRRQKKEIQSKEEGSLVPIHESLTPEPHIAIEPLPITSSLGNGMEILPLTPTPAHQIKKPSVLKNSSSSSQELDLSYNEDDPDKILARFQVEHPISSSDLDDPEVDQILNSIDQELLASKDIGFKQKLAYAREQLSQPLAKFKEPALIKKAEFFELVKTREKELESLAGYIGDSDEEEEHDSDFIKKAEIFIEIAELVKAREKELEPLAGYIGDSDEEEEHNSDFIMAEDFLTRKNSLIEEDIYGYDKPITSYQEFIDLTEQARKRDLESQAREEEESSELNLYYLKANPKDNISQISIPQPILINQGPVILAASSASIMGADIALAEVIKESELPREKQEVVPQHQIKLESFEYISPLVEFAPSSYYLTQKKPSELVVTPDVTEEAIHQVFTEHQELLEFVPVSKNNIGSISVPSPILAKQDQAILATPSASIMGSDIVLAEVIKESELPREKQEEGLLAPKLTVINTQYEKRREETVRLLAKGREELVLSQQLIAELQKSYMHLQAVQKPPTKKAEASGVMQIEKQLAEVARTHEAFSLASLERENQLEQQRQKLQELDNRRQLLDAQAEARIKAEKEFNEREEELLRISLAVANEKYEKRREETARLLAAGSEELVLTKAARETTAASGRELSASLTALNESGLKLAEQVGSLDLAGQLLADRFGKLRGSGISLQESSHALHTAGIKLSEQVDVLNDSGIALAEVIKKSELSREKQEEALLAQQLAVINAQYERRREETARLLAAGSEELVLTKAARETTAASGRELSASLTALNESGLKLAEQVGSLDLAGQLLADRFGKLRGSGISLQESSHALHTAGIKLSEQVDVLNDSGIALAEVIKKSELSRVKQEVVPEPKIKLESSEYISPLLEFVPNSFYLTQNEPSELVVTQDVTDEAIHQVFTEHEELLEFVPTFKVMTPSLTIESSSTPVKVSEKTTPENNSKIFAGTSNNINLTDTNLHRNINKEIENKLATGISRHILTAMNLEISKKHEIINSTWLLNKGSSTSHKESQMGVNAGDNGDNYLAAKGLWISGLYGHTVNNKNSNSYKGNLAGTTLGFDIPPTGQTLIGIAYSNINAIFRYTNAKSNVNAQGFAFYSQHLFLNNYIIEGLISITRSKVNSIANKKTSEGLYKQATAKFKSTSFSGELSAGYIITTSLGLTLIPNIGIKYANHKDGSYKEIGDSGMNLEVHPIKAEQRLTTAIGFKTIFPKVINSNTAITHYSNFSIENYFSNKPKVKAKLTWMDNYFEGKYGEDKVNTVGFNAGYGLVIKYNNIELSTNYHYHVENKLQNHQGSIKFKALF